MQTFYTILGAFGITYIFVYEDGPFNILLKIRRLITPLRCVPCAVVWLAIPLVVYAGIGFVGYIAVIGGVILLDMLVQSW